MNLKKPIRYTAVCGLLSACLILLCSYRAEGILAKETAAQTAEESQAVYEIPRVQAGIGAYLEALEDLDRDFPKAVNSLATSASTIIELDASDYDCLLRIVESEAGICDQKGKVLVANVILNRVESEHFPDTVEEVVYQKKQFSPVENGTIDRVTVTEETKTAVSMALSGIDYSEGALFFAARKAADPKNMNWFDRTLDFLFEHDGHEFFTLR